MEKFDVSLNLLQTGRMVIEASKSIERKGQNKNSKIEFHPYPTDTECDLTLVEFSTRTNTWLLQDEHLSSRGVGVFPEGYFIFNAGVTDFMTIFDEQLPDSFGCKSLISGMLEVRFKMMEDLLANVIC